MRTFLTAVILALGLASPGSAQQAMGYYLALLGPADFFNSSGTRLRDFCAIVQQDRANFHRFGQRDPADQSDPFFASRDNRAVIGSSCGVFDGYGYIRRDVLNGVPRYVLVTVYGTGNRITRVMVQEGAG